MLFLSAKSMSGSTDAMSAMTWKGWMAVIAVHLIVFGFGVLAAMLQ